MQTLWEYLTFRRLVGTTLIAIAHALGLALIATATILAWTRGAPLLETLLAAALMATGLRITCEVLFTLCQNRR